MILVHKYNIMEANTPKYAYTDIIKDKINYLSNINNNTKKLAYRILQEMDKYDCSDPIFKFSVDFESIDGTYILDDMKNKISFYWYEMRLFLIISDTNYELIKIGEVDVYKHTYPDYDYDIVIDNIKNIY